MSAALVLLLAIGPVAQPTPTEERGKAFVTALEKGQFAEAAKGFDDTMKKALPGDGLQDLWKKVLSQVGAFQKQLGVRSEKAGVYVVVLVTCKFEKATLDVKVVYDKEQRVSGLNFLPADVKELYPPPAYARPDSFSEKEVKVGSGDWILPGTLTLPKGDGPFPAVVLVHGSGPHDRDSTIGRVKPLRDLAWGLASNGIAVLRYEKRTREHGAALTKVKTFTVKEETIDDALAGAELLRNTAGIDPKRVFILGHSQGALLAPRMALADKALAGVVMLAAPSRPLEDVLLEQTTNRLAKRAEMAAEEVELLEKLQKVGQLVKDNKLKADTPPSELLGLTPDYWKSICSFSATTEALQVDRPMLILQGEGDVQVILTDFAGWQKAMAGRKNVTLKSYPKLGHMFTPTDGKGDPAELARPANVSGEVITDIAAWIKGKP
jgi:dienelactone hydrolase